MNQTSRNHTSPSHTSPSHTSTAARIFTIPTDEGALLSAQEYLPAGPVDQSLPTVVLAHGWTMTRESWRPVIDELLSREPVRVIAYDQRGHGDSTMGRTKAPSIRQLGEDLHAVISALVPEGDLVLGGHSMGGMTMMTYAAQHPEDFTARTRGALLCSTSASVANRKALVPFEHVAMALLARGPRIAPGRLLPARVQGPMIFGRGADPEHVRTAVAMIQRTKLPVTGSYYKALGGHEAIEALELFADVPTDIVVGSRDRLTPPAWARVMADAIPHATYTEIADKGHMLTYEATEVVTEAIAHHLRQAHQSSHQSSQQV